VQAEFQVDMTFLEIWNFIKAKHVFGTNMRGARPYYGVILELLIGVNRQCLVVEAICRRWQMVRLWMRLIYPEAKIRHISSLLLPSYTLQNNRQSLARTMVLNCEKTEAPGKKVSTSSYPRVEHQHCHVSVYTRAYTIVPVAISCRCSDRLTSSFVACTKVKVGSKFLGASSSDESICVSI